MFWIQNTGGVVRSRYNAGVACADVPAGTAPDRTAIVCEAQGRSTSLTFRDLARQSSNVAARLVEAGVEPGAPIGVFAPAGTIAAVAHLGVLKAGAVTLPLVPLLGDDAILHRLADARVATLLAAPALVDKARMLLGGNVIPLDEHLLAGEPGADFEPAPVGPDDPAILLYTSGTTGKPKGALLPHRVVLARQVPLSMIHGPFLPDDVFWTPADWLWVGSFVDAVLAPLSHGCTVMTYERRRFDAVEAVEQIKASGVTRAFIPPTALRRLMDVPAGAWTGHRLRSVHSGGEPLTPEAAAWALEMLGIVVDEIYGMTEASFVIGNAHRFSPVVSGSMGRPFPGQAVRIVDADGQPVGVDQPGDLVVSGGSPSLFLGYYGQPEATASRFLDGWFVTGDIARRDADGRLFYVARKDDLITSSGHRIGPGEIEDVLRTHPEVRDVVVVGEPDAARGQRVKAVVQLRDGSGPPRDGLSGELRDLVRMRVGRHAYPRSIEYLVEFPRTVTGKVRRDLLRLPAGDRR